MSDALLDKARAILAHPKQGLPPKANTIGEAGGKVSMTEPTSPAFTSGGNASPQAAPATKAIEIEPAPSNAKAIYWETGTSQILGPATPEFLAQDGDSFWIVTTFEEQIRWINADRLRSRKAFEDQAEVREVELIRF